jgi:hypothetical protein
MRDILHSSPTFLCDTHALYKRTANKHSLFNRIIFSHRLTTFSLQLIVRLGGLIMSQRLQDDAKLGPHTLHNRDRISLYSEQRLVTLYYVYHNKYTPIPFTFTGMVYFKITHTHTHTTRYVSRQFTFNKGSQHFE